MAGGKASNITDLIQKVASSCIITPLPCRNAGDTSDDGLTDQEDDGRAYSVCYGSVNGRSTRLAGEQEEEEEEERFRLWEEEEKRDGAAERAKAAEEMMAEVFEAVSAVKRAYAKLQEAHCPWDPERMRAADAAVVTELRRLGRLKERWWFRRGSGGGGGEGVGRAAAVEPYEAAVEELKRELRAKEAEVEGLKERLRRGSDNGDGGGGGGGRRRTSGHRGARRKGSQGIDTSATPELFLHTMNHVKESLKSFTGHLLSLMRSARCDIAATVRSIEGPVADVFTAVELAQTHADYALESYVSLKLFQGFENESFYIDGSLSSLLEPAKFQQDCYSQFHHMKPMEPSELLDLLPTCPFGKFCCKKYLAIVHPKMEESLFKNLDQRKQVLAAHHPGTNFYGVFLKLAKAVWLLHLLAFALDPAPSHFQANQGADYHPDYMESVVKFPAGRVPDRQMVWFPVTPGFKLGDGSIIKARVYLSPRI